MLEAFQCAALLVGLVAIFWADAYVPWPKALDDPRFSRWRSNGIEGVRRRPSDPWRVLCCPGKLTGNGSVREPTWRCVVDDVPFARHQVSLLPTSNDETVDLGPSWGPVSSTSDPDERARRILSVDGVHEALVGFLSQPDVLQVDLGTGRLTAHLRRSDLHAAEDIERVIGRVADLAGVVVPACRAESDDRWQAASLGATSAPVSTGLRLKGP